MQRRYALARSNGSEVLQNPAIWLAEDPTLPRFGSDSAIARALHTVSTGNSLMNPRGQAQNIYAAPLCFSS